MSDAPTVTDADRRWQQLRTMAEKLLEAAEDLHEAGGLAACAALGGPKSVAKALATLRPGVRRSTSASGGWSAGRGPAMTRDRWQRARWSDPRPAPRRMEVLLATVDAYVGTGWPPTVTEVAARLADRPSDNAVAHTLAKLAWLGYVGTRRGRWGWRLVPEALRRAREARTWTTAVEPGATELARAAALELIADGVYPSVGLVARCVRLRPGAVARIRRQLIAANRWPSDPRLTQYTPEHEASRRARIARAKREADQGRPSAALANRPCEPRRGRVVGLANPPG